MSNRIISTFISDIKNNITKNTNKKKIGKLHLPKSFLKPKWFCAINIQNHNAYLFISSKEIDRKDFKDPISIISVNALSPGSAESQSKKRARELHKKFNKFSNERLTIYTKFI